jgi:plasmid stabilization system protein ParE
MDYKVIWDEEAIEELRQIVRHISHYNPIAARKTGETMLKKAGSLGTHPHLGKIYSKLNRDDVREIPVPPYRIFYHIKDAGRTVQILKIWHGARQEPELK